jgi:hypothetical protein
MLETAPQREERSVLRGVMFFVALFAIPGGLYGVIAQHAVGAAVAVVGGLVCLGIWWLTRRRYASAQARRLGVLCCLLTITVAAAAVLAAVLFLASPSYGVSVSTLMPAIIAGVATVALLTARLAAGHRLKVLAAPEIAAARAARRPVMTGAGAPPQPPGWSGLSSGPIADLQQRWRSGQYQSTPTLTVQPDGTLVLRPRRVRGQVRGWHRGSAAALPFALILIARTFLTTGWIGLVIVAAGVAAVLLVLLSLYELRVRHGAAILTARDLIVPTWYGRRRGVSRGQVASAALVRARQSRGPATPMLLAVGGNGHCLLRLSTTSIPDDDVLAFAAALMVPVDVRADRMELEELTQRYPGSVPWWWMHPAVLGLLIALVIVLIVVGVVVGLAVGGVIQSSSGQPG